MRIAQRISKASSGHALRRSSSRRLRGLLHLVIITGVSAAQTSHGWTHFVSSSGFSTSYPSTWLRRGDSSNRLDIVDSKQGAEGMIASPTQRNIMVFAMDTTESFATFRSRYTHGLTILRPGRNHKHDAETYACNEPEIIVGSEPTVPPEDVAKTPPNFIRTMYFCKIADKGFVTILTNIEGDVHQRPYEKVALQITRRIELKP